ncbi:hypothetical protein GGR57DRAFT_376217 [Xylariaceae sp. FL1272]|nr:hypothetical protein GGR57DRAFT_376217 [Xylariaceae sp. FL1272]
MGDDEIDFRAMPKIELHAHLSGSISRECLHEIWARKKQAGQTDLEDPLVVMPVGKHDYDLETFFPLFSSYIYRLVNDVSSLRFSTQRVVEEFARDGVVYLELRTTPRAMPEAGLSKSEYVQEILSALAIAQESSHTIRVKLILSIDRRNNAEEAHEVLALAQQFKNRGVVGVDLCGDPTKGDVSTFRSAFQAAKRAGMGITVHFAEAEQSASERELDEILSWEPDRLGHVIHVPERIKKEIAQRGLGLELCLSCNVLAGMIMGRGFEEHHFGEWWDERGGKAVIVPCTDDVGVFGSPVSNEWSLIKKHFGLSRAEILSLARNGIDVIFGGDEEQRRLRSIMWTA